MSHEVLMPQLGMAQNSAIIVGWKKSVGDAVSTGELLLEVETDKAVMEVESRHNGFVVEIVGAVGSEVPVGEVIAVIAESSEGLSESAGTVPMTSDAGHDSGTEAKGSLSPVTTEAPQAESAGQKSARAEYPVQTKNSSAQVLASPKARRLAFERGIDLAALINAGLSQPLQAGSIPSSIAVNQPSALKACGDLTEIDRFIEWSKQENDSPVCMQKLMCAFLCHSLPDAPAHQQSVIRFNDVTDEIRFWKVTGHSLNGVVEVDHPEHWDMDILDFTNSAIAEYVPGDPMCNPTLMLSANPFRHGRAITLTLFFTHERFSNDSAVRCLQTIVECCADPLLDVV